MKILGIDPGSTIMGWAAIETKPDLRIINYNSIKYNVRKFDFNDRLLLIYDDIIKIIEKISPDIIGIEQNFVSFNPRTGLKLGAIQGVLVLAAKKLGCKIEFVTASQSRKLLFGKGCKKEEAHRMCCELLKRPDLLKKPRDITDAFVVALYVSIPKKPS